MAEPSSAPKRVLIAGGASGIGLGTAVRLAASDLVSEVAVAGRKEDRLQKALTKIGAKGRAVTLDATDEPRLTAVAKDYDIVLVTAGPAWEVLLPALRATIAAGVHYCDVAGDGPIVEAQLELDAAAKAQDVVAIPGMGTSPGADNLLAVHACRQLDRTEELQLSHYVTGYYKGSASGKLRSGRVDLTLQEVLVAMSKPARIYRDGAHVDVDGSDSRLDVELPSGRHVTAYPYSHSQVITLPRCLRDIRNVSRLWAVPNGELGELLMASARRIAGGEMSAEEATRSFLETIAEAPDRWLDEPAAPSATGSSPGPDVWGQNRWMFWIVATGWKDRKRRRYMCWPCAAAGGGLEVATLRILRGSVTVRGVVPPEACFEPLPFLEEAGWAIGESAEWLT